MKKIYNQAEFYMKEGGKIDISYISGCFMQSLTGLYSYLSAGNILNRIDKKSILNYFENMDALIGAGIYAHNIIAIYKTGKKYIIIYKVDLV